MSRIAVLSRGTSYVLSPGGDPDGLIGLMTGRVVGLLLVHCCSVRLCVLVEWSVLAILAKEYLFPAHCLFRP